MLNTTGSSGLSVEMKTFYDRLLLTRTVPVLLFAKFGQKRNIPKNGGKTIEFRRFGALAVATTALTEGALFTNLKAVTVTSIEATIAQYGDAVGFSDLVSTTTIDPVLTETTELLGEQSAETIDQIIRDVVVAGTTVQYASTAAARTDLTAAMVLNPAEVREAVLTLKLNRAKKIDGFYQAIIHPRQEHDLISSSEWREAQNYAQSGRIFDGSIGTLYGVKFWVTDVAPVYTDGGASNADVYGAMFFGAEAFGVVSLSGHNLRTIYKSLGSAGTADPLDQQQTMGWKAAFVAKILNDLFMVRLETGASTGS
jgi:N4-gp56 family major capsid protein